MGIFDRFRTSGQTVADLNVSKMGKSEQYATRLIEDGHVLEADGRLDEAMQRYMDAIDVAPNPARAHLNRGNVLLLKGDLPGALDAFNTAIKHKPDYAGAYYNIGNGLLGNKQFDEAVANYHRALEIQPDYAEVHCALGVALKELGQLDNAVASFRKTLEINPDLAEAHTNLGVALQGLGQIDEAVASHRRSLGIDPNLAETHSNLGNALQELGQLESAVACYLRSLEIKPYLVETHTNMGIVLQALGQLDGAMASYRRALEINPDYAAAHNSLGNSLQELRQSETALASHRRALEIKPDFSEAYVSLGNVLQDLGQIDEAVASYRRALEIEPGLIVARGNLLFVLKYYASYTPSYYLEQARQYGRIVAARVRRRFTDWKCTAQPERLRVGLVSGDLLTHPVSFFLEGLLARIDPASIELIAYPTHHKEDELTERIRPYFSAWKPMFGLSDEAAARMIHADNVHILLDISGYTRYNRLPIFAWKPAPVQVSWLGYFATTGVAEMDYLLADEVGVPEAERQQFTETVRYLPDTRLCFTAPKADLAVSPLPAMSNDMITFGCFQNLTKLGDEVLEAWGNIFTALPKARLRMQCKQLREPMQVEKLLQRLQRFGIDPARVVTHGSSNREAYLAAHAEVDLILDTFPYPGGTTTCEALWMGVPTLTLAGNSMLARQGASLLTAAGLEEWVTASKEEYIANAIALASDRPKLSALRAGLRQQVLASPLFDAQRFARHFEDALWGMWQGYQAQQGKSE